MIITQVDHIPDLYKIENILPEQLIEKINAENFWAYEWEEQEMQSGWKRRKLALGESSPLAEVDVYLNEALTQIENAVNIVFEHKFCWSSFWFDYEGFTCSIHEDGEERNYTPHIAMQIYLLKSHENLGTVFYNSRNANDVRYVFPYKINTGYLMLNRPGQWHGMTNTVPADCPRLSSYTYFGNFNHK